MANINNDADFTSGRVTKEGRKSNLSMFMVMLGFTFFSASMWVGQQMAAGLNFGQFIGALILGGIILGAYTGALGYIGAETGLTLDMLAHRSFGRKGSWLPSAMISFTQIGWFGVGLAMFAIPVAKELLGLDVTMEHMPYQGYLLVALAGLLMTASAYFGIKSLTIISYIAVPAVGILGTVAMILAVKRGDASLVDQFAVNSGTLSVIGGAGLVVGSFVSGGTATPNFARFSKNAKIGCLVTVIAFFLGNSLMFFFGAVSSIYVGGAANDIFDVMMKLGLFWMAVLVLGLNIWTTNDNALYSSGLGLSNIFGFSKKTMVLVAGIIGTIAAVWLYWNFCGWLNILNCTLPPIGAILIISYFMNRNDYKSDNVKIDTVNWASVIGVVLGAVVANLLHWGIASINGMVVAIICYLIGHALSKK
ncbi:MAG: cytosine permease [Bacteroidaceae bacterium]|nr:cytosine permease [Bacteroidaceae bacterium]MBR6857476.1 cytosine permease [Bacteroidaceae bacterium]